VFRGLHWLVIHNSTVPVVAGGGQNAYSLLTTSFLSPLTGYVLGALVIAALWLVGRASRAARLKLGLPVADTERHLIGFIVAAQIIALVVIVANGYRGLPLALLILAAVALLVHVITRHTTFGRCLYAIGGNEEAAVVSGVPVRNTVIAAFGLMGVIVALTGFMQTAYSGATTTTIGSLMELDAIAACVIGGTSLRGGRGSVIGVLFGALIMASLLNGMTLMAVSPEIKYIARGGVLALAVWLDLRVARRSG
jgi:D-xylose transport system permease protein